LYFVLIVFAARHTGKQEHCLFVDYLEDLGLDVEVILTFIAQKYWL
jgi:hypothetical protein